MPNFQVDPPKEPPNDPPPDIPGVPESFWYALLAWLKRNLGIKDG